MNRILQTACIPLFLVLIIFPCQSQNGNKIADKLSPIPYKNVHIEGMLGQKIDSCIKNGVMAVNYHLYSIPFRDKSDKGGLFQGEFWGKWFTSAVFAYAYQPTREHKAIIESSLKEILSTQDPDGRISSYPREETFVNWDIWGRKYVLLGLMSYYDLTGDKKILDAACRAADELISIAGPGKQKLTETGLQILGSMSSNSILEPLVLLYQRTGQEKYLVFTRYLVSLWSEPNAYTSNGMMLIEDALNNVPPVGISSPKAYEMMSCFEGLCEMYRATGDSLYLRAVVKFAESLLEREIMIVGSGSRSELWCDGAYRQTELLEQPMETCVTVTWLKLCYQLLRLTGNSAWADQMEITLYNALSGAMCDNGHWWAYFSPLAGERIPSPMQVPTCEASCCVANGPRGLLTVPGWAVMTGESGPVVNLYTTGEWTCKLNNGTSIQLIQATDYPVGNKVVITVRQKKTSSFAIKLRIPHWSRNSELRINNEAFPCKPGEYAQIFREWKNGDSINLSLDLRGRIIPSPGDVNCMAVIRGPIVLALDNRMVQSADYDLWLYPENTVWIQRSELGGLRYILPQPVSLKPAEQYIDLKPAQVKPENVWMAFEVPFLYRYTHFFKHEIKTLVMCDYASAGNLYSNDNLFRVWLPQPLFMNDIFPENTWRLLYRDSDKRPQFPDNMKSPVLDNTWHRQDNQQQ